MNELSHHPQSHASASAPTLPMPHMAPLPPMMPMHPMSFAPPPQQKSMAEDLNFYTRIVKRSGPLVIIGIVFCLTIAIIYLAKLKTSYSASVKLLIVQHGNNPNSKDRDTTFAIEDATSYLSTQALIIRSGDVIRKAVENTTKKVDETKLPPWLSNDSIQHVNDRLEVVPSKDEAKIISLNLKSDVRDIASKLLDEIVISYDSYLHDTYSQKTNALVAIINAAVETTQKTKVKAQEEFFKQSKDFPVYLMDDTGRSFFVRKLDQLNQRVITAQMRASELQAKLVMIEDMEAKGLGYDEILVAIEAFSRSNNADPRQMANLDSDDPNSSSFDQQPRGHILNSKPSKSFEQVAAQIREIRTAKFTAQQTLGLLKEQLIEERKKIKFETLVENELKFNPQIQRYQSQLLIATSEYNSIRARTRQTNDTAVTQAKSNMEQVAQILATYRKNLAPKIREQIEKEGSTGGLARRITMTEDEISQLNVHEKVFQAALEELRPAYVRKLKDRREKILESAGPDDEEVQQIEKAIAAANSTLNVDSKAARDSKTWVLKESCKTNIDMYNKQATLFQEQHDAELKANADGEQKRQIILSLKEDAQRSSDLHNQLLNKLKEAKLMEYTTIKAQRIGDITTNEVSPPYSLILAMAVVVGCGLGLGGGFLLEMMDTRIHSLEELKSILNMNVLGVIPMLPKYQQKLAKRVGMITHDKPRSLLAESYKSLRTHYEFLRRNQNHQVVLLTSAMSGDGKTTSSSNLAISLAKAGRKVLLVDADIRRPKLTEQFNVPRRNGLSQVLQNLIALDQAVNQTEVENLHFLNAGQEVPNPSELLLSAKLREFIDEARAKYEVVIIDSSPLLAITDPCIIGSEVDGIILVVNPTRLRRQDAMRCMDLLRSLGTTILGVVVNGIPEPKKGYGYYGYGYYGYGYGSSGSNPYIQQDEDAERHAAEGNGYVNPNAHGHNHNGLAYPPPIESLHRPQPQSPSPSPSSQPPIPPSYGHGHNPFIN